MNMLLYYHRDPLGNFGDDLNPWLWERLFPSAFAGCVVHDPRLRCEFDAKSSLFIGIGTLLNSNVPKENPKIVLGAGVGYGEQPVIDDTWRILSVRGPLTAQRLGLPNHVGLIDPAVLAVDFSPLTGTESDRNVVSYMPHCGSARNANWATIASEAGVNFIDPQWPVERVLSALRQTRLLITEALHGAILAESYRIPWVPVKSSPRVLEFKWNDWCLSIGLEYRPTRIPALWPENEAWAASLKAIVKRRIVVSRIRAIAARANGQLAGDGIFADKKGQLLDVIDKLRSELSSRVISNTAV
ncbi:MAG: polysaccharide pyruvyl transferase family protein [Polaromonas sp.]|nr:polysaccharide pyruvyl transferase family protein [Polaromonas sp.]